MIMRRSIIAASLTAVLGLATVPAQAASACTWGGATTAPTGTFTVRPGLTNTPSTGPLAFYATGALGGDCAGKLVFDGTLDARATCAFATFSGETRGLTGIERFVGVGTLVAPSRLFDEAGNLAGVELPQIVTGTGSGSEASDCNTTQGFTDGSFSSTIALSA